MPISEEMLAAAREAAAKIDADVFFYNGTIGLPRCLTTIEEVFKHQSRPQARLFLTTNGGDPDVAYKITRYFQDRYEHFTVIVAGKCKSAGTLIALGANELAFTPYGELGPLDIQLSKVDKFDELQSGLTIQESLNTLEDRATDKFFTIVKDYISANNGQLSFASASKAASDFVTQLYAPVMARIDPEEVGTRARSMKIGTDYGKRLMVKSQNLKPGTLRTLSETYPSHSFVIDQIEAQGLFYRVRDADGDEKTIVQALGRNVRFQGTDFAFHALSAKLDSAAASKGADNGTTQPGRGKPANGRDSERAIGTANPASKAGKRSTRSQNGRSRTAAH